MRSLQMMRRGRRTTSTNHELAQSMRNSFSFTSLSKHRNSMSLFSNERNAGVYSSNDSLFKHRRNTLFSNIPSSSRRLSFQQQDTIELTKPQTNLRNFYIFFLLLFLFLFISLVYSFIRMIKNSD